MHSYLPFIAVGVAAIGLNPCFNGRCTRTVPVNPSLGIFRDVLILVLMEDALVL